MGMGRQISDLTSGVFFKTIAGSLMQKHRVSLVSDEQAQGRVSFSCPAWKVPVDLGMIPAGQSAFDVYLPDYREQTQISVEWGEAKRVFTISPRKHWELHAIPVTHHDIGYTKSMDDVLCDYFSYYDDILSFLDKTSSFPDEAKYRYTVESSITFLHYLENRPKEILERYLKYLHEGRMEVSAFYCNIIDGNADREEMIRLMYPSFALKRKFGVPITSASIVDIPGLSGSIPALLAGSGIKYFFAGIPGYFRWNKPGYPLPKNDFWDEQAVLGPAGRPAAFRWQAPDGSSVLVYYQGGYGKGLRGFFDTPQDVCGEIEERLLELEAKELPFSVDRYIDFGGDNHPPRIDISEFTRGWNKEFTYPRMIVSTNSRFFEALNAQASSSFTVYGELPHTDYTVNSYSAAWETALSRRTHSRLGNLESLCSFVAMANGKDYDSRGIMRIYRDLLTYDEHCFGMYIPMGLGQDWSWNSKRGYVLRAGARTENSLGDALRDLAECVQITKPGMYAVVYNPVSHNRKDVVRISSFEGMDRGITVSDARTGRVVPHQVVKVDRPDRAMPYASHRYALGIQDALVVTKDRVQLDHEFLYDLAFLCDELPSMGYAAYYIDFTGEKQALRPVERECWNGSVENEFYRIDVDMDKKTISSVYDKKNKRELIDKGCEYGFGQMVVRQVDAGETLVSVPTDVRLAERGPLFSTLAISAECGGGIRLVQEITLYGGIDRIDICNRVMCDSAPMREVYFAFPFDVSNPEFSLNTAGFPEMVPFRDQMAGSNSNYYSAQHWSMVKNDEITVAFIPIDANVVEFGGLWPCYVSQGHHGLPSPGFVDGFISQEQMHQRGHIYSFVMNNNFRTNFCSVQNTDCLFRYSIATWKGNENYNRGIRQMGMDVINPPAVHAGEGPSAGRLPLAGSFCQITGGEAAVQAIKRAEDGRGFILRIFEEGGVESEITVNLPWLALSRVSRTNIVEEDTFDFIETETHEFSFRIKPFETATFRLQSGYMDDAGYKFYRDNGSTQRALYGQ